MNLLEVVKRFFISFGAHRYASHQGVVQDDGRPARRLVIIDIRFRVVGYPMQEITVSEVGKPVRSAYVVYLN